MPDAPRPSLKLKIGKKSPDQSPQQSPPAPARDTSNRKITLKIPPKSEDDQEDERPKRKKSKKRPADELSLNESAAAVASEQSGPKRLKLKPSKKGVQSIRIKNKGLVPNRPIGVGYDSEASDTEADPAVEEQFILRMVPGADCEYLRQAINERRLDRGEIAFKPLNREGRRAVLKIRDKQYAAALVDLPCIVEGMKSWDRRGWYKSADICQMLLVLGQVANDREALEYPLPKDVQLPDDKTLQYPHGLTAPLRWVRKRRFRERVSTRTIEQVEKAVEDLINQDNLAVMPPQYELLDSTSLNRAEGLVQSGGEYDEEDYDEEQDADGDVDEGQFEPADIEAEDALAAEMEAALAAGADDMTAPRGPAELPQTETPTAMKQSSPGETSEDESDVSGDEGDEVPEEELDDEQLEQQRQLQQLREEIGELDALIRAETAKWEKMQNAILKNKMAKRIQDLKQALSLKKVSIGEGDDVDT